MSHYIVRVYRTEPQEDRADRLYGVVEKVETGRKLIFRNFEELWSMLSSADTIQYRFKSDDQRKNPQGKRAEYRFSYQSPMIYRPNDGVGNIARGGDATGKLLDISRSGMKMETSGKITHQDVLKVSIPMAKPPIIFQFLAQVKWVWRNRPGTRLVGMRFIPSSAKDGPETKNI